MFSRRFPENLIQVRDGRTGGGTLTNKKDRQRRFHVPSKNFLKRPRRERRVQREKKKSKKKAPTAGDRKSYWGVVTTLAEGTSPTKGVIERKRRERNKRRG